MNFCLPLNENEWYVWKIKLRDWFIFVPSSSFGNNFLHSKIKLHIMYIYFWTSYWVLLNSFHNNENENISKFKCGFKIYLFLLYFSRIVIDRRHNPLIHMWLFKLNPSKLSIKREEERQLFLNIELNLSKATRRLMIIMNLINILNSSFNYEPINY